MNYLHRNSLKTDLFGLPKATSHDSCLDHVKEASDCGSSRTGLRDRRQRRATIMSTSPRSSLVEISKSGSSTGSKFMTFFQRGFNMHKSKSSSKLQKEKPRSKADRISLTSSLQDIIPIPIRETAIQGHSRTLFHKVPDSNLRPRPLIMLTEETKIVPIHSSIISNMVNHCVKILAASPNVYRGNSGNTFDPIPPPEERSFGDSRYSSQLSLQSMDRTQRPILGYVFSCNSSTEQKKWIDVLTRVARPDLQNQRRKEISLNIWIQEAKNIPAKKRYFCEIYLDGALHGRTTTKTMGDMLFWGEEFNLSNLDEVHTMTLLLWRCIEEGRSKKKKSHPKLICQINISTREIDRRTNTERWYAPSKSGPVSTADPTTRPNGLPSPPFSAAHSLPKVPLGNHSPNAANHDQVPMLRVKARYQHLEVLPLSSYTGLINFLNENAVKTLAEIEPHLKVKAKEDLSLNLVRITYKQGTVVPILCDLIVNEINKSDDKNLILRGNTMASKAMEIYLKLIGEKYLQLTLSDFINRVLLGHDDCEVDPQKERFDFYGGCGHAVQSSPAGDKAQPQYSLPQRQESLLMNVEMIWAKIMSSSIYFPKDLRIVFVTLRQRLHGSRTCQAHGDHNDQPDLCDRIISACIFLRYICPAILTPSLFGLIPEYPDNPKVTRTFTLVAKCIQTLANFSNLCGTKETYMVFMNHFIESNFKTMRHFLREISWDPEADPCRPEPRPRPSSEPSGDGKECSYWESLSSNLPEDSIDLALSLATLHQQMEDCLQGMEPQTFSGNLRTLQAILSDLNGRLQSQEALMPLGQIRVSSSYRNLKVQAQTHPEALRRISLNEREASRSSNSYVEQKLPYMGPKHKPQRSEYTSVSSQSHLAEATPTHQAPSRAPAVADYLMVQSMIDSYEAPKSQDSMQQVEKEWKEMLSESNKSRERFFAEHGDINSSSKSMNSSGYQTLSRSSESVGGVPEGIPVPKSPAVTWKPSVKKCKQTRRQTDVIPRPDTFGINAQTNLPMKVKDLPQRSVSIEEIRHLSSQNFLCHLNDEGDFASTQTLTAGSDPKGIIEASPEDHQKLSSAVSSPAFLATYESEASRRPGPYSVFQDPCANEHSMQSRRKPLGSNECLDPSEKSAFHDTSKSKQPHSREKRDLVGRLTEGEAETIKCSLNHIRQTLNSRMKQLLLSDRTTIQLELERVKLMRQICDTAEVNTSMSSDNLVLFQYQNPFNAQATNGNVSRAPSDPKVKKTMSFRKYLELAENVLIEAYNNHSSAEKGKDGLFEREMEDFLVQIFQTNQYLQIKLTTASHGPANPENPLDQNSYIIRRGQIVYNVHKADPRQTTAGSPVTRPLGGLPPASTSAT